MSLVNTIVLEEIRKIDPDASLITRLDDLPLDSLEFLDLLLTLEKRFEISIADEQLQNLAIVNDLTVAFSR